MLAKLDCDLSGDLDDYCQSHGCLYAVLSHEFPYGDASLRCLRGSFAVLANLPAADRQPPWLPKNTMRS